MKKILIVGILFFVRLNGFSQIEPTQNYEQVLKNEKLKGIKTMFYRSEDTTKSEGRLLFTKEFSKEGRLIRKYLYTFWDVVSYDHTTSYKYDLKGNLIEKTTIQKILNLSKRDKDFIKEMGDNPINEKSFYIYNESNKLIKEVNYTFGRDGFDKNDDPSNTIDYVYDKKGKLISEIGKTPNGLLIYQNYEASYEYDSDGNRIKVVKVFTTSPDKDSSITIYSYNGKGELIAEKTENSDPAWENVHLKYEYDNAGRKTKVLMFSQIENSWTVSQTFSYDKNGHPILGNDETTFNFYENGLVKRELWKSRGSDEVVNFITTYQFY